MLKGITLVYKPENDIFDPHLNQSLLYIMANQANHSSHERTILWIILPAAVFVSLLFTNLNHKMSHNHKPVLSADLGNLLSTGDKKEHGEEHGSEAAHNEHSAVKLMLPSNVEMEGHANGLEDRLIKYISNPEAKLDKADWFDFDKITFASGTDKLEGTSLGQLKNLSQILDAYPNVKVKIGGYTDNVGDAAKNMELSKKRASSVVAELVKMGVAADRLSSEGYGDTVSIADNANEEGRSKNRRMALRVTAK